MGHGYWAIRIVTGVYAEILNPWDAFLGDRFFNSFAGQLVQRVHSQTQRGDRVAIAMSLWKVTAGEATWPSLMSHLCIPHRVALKA